MTRTKTINFPNSETELTALFDKLQRAACNLCFNSGALAIFGASSPNAKTVNTISYIVDGVIAQKAAATMPALGGAVVPNGSFNVYVFAVDASGNLTTLNGTPGATLASVVWPTVADGTVVLGILIVQNGTGSNFTPGTTALDTGSLTTTYINATFPFVPGLQSL